MLLAPGCRDYGSDWVLGLARAGDAIPWSYEPTTDMGFSVIIHSARCPASAEKHRSPKRKEGWDMPQALGLLLTAGWQGADAEAAAWPLKEETQRSQCPHTWAVTPSPSSSQAGNEGNISSICLEVFPGQMAAEVSGNCILCLSVCLTSGLSRMQTPCVSAGYRILCKYLHTEDREVFKQHPWHFSWFPGSETANAKGETSGAQKHCIPPPHSSLLRVPASASP